MALVAASATARAWRASVDVALVVGARVGIVLHAQNAQDALAHQQRHAQPRFAGRSLLFQPHFGQLGVEVAMQEQRPAAANDILG